MYIYSNLFLV